MFYSDRQLGIELDPNAGRQAGIDFVGQSSRAFPSSLHQQPVGFVSEQGFDFPDPVRRAVRGFIEPDSRQAIPRQYPHNGEPSPRLGQNDEGNITQRDVKRPKERSRDKAYKQRFSMGSSGGMGDLPNPAFFVSGVSGQDKAISASKSTPVYRSTTPRSPGPPIQSWENGYVQPPSVVRGLMRASAASPANFEISLTYSGSTVTHRVWDEMPIAQLMNEVGSIFGLDSSEVILVLSSSPPMTLQRGGNIAGPPRVYPGSTVIVLYVRQIQPSRPSPVVPYVPPTSSVSLGHGFQGIKFLLILITKS